MTKILILALICGSLFFTVALWLVLKAGDLIRFFKAQRNTDTHLIHAEVDEE